ncbi:MAG TPA: YbhB/YbcL family Raf kinase inhibitor-like protein [Parafilimonas sp.]|nr:YbhB/YbcL family Raf kinase inhibitor-like protein [Parafilimonas sp.]
MAKSNKNVTSVVDFKNIEVSSSAFKNGEFIPAKYTCEGENISPELSIKNIPQNTKSLALIVDDPDAPLRTWVHWIIWNIPVTHHIKENDVHGKEGLNDFQIHRYSGPCPPKGVHHYFFKVYALDDLLDLPGNIRKGELEKAMSDHIIGFGELVGLYKRK